MATPASGSGPSIEERIAQLQAAIAAQESLRPTLGDAVVDLTVAALRKQMAQVEQERVQSPPEAAIGDHAERKPVSVLFADLVGFTSLSERTDAETARRLMNRCFDALKAVIDHYGGHVDKYIGDEIMVLFGAPVAYEDHAERALRAALAMRPALQAFNEQLAGDPQLAALPAEMRTLSMHAGVNTGLVIAGGIGAQDLQQYSVVGDAVNVASRLTDLSQADQILVGETTYQLTAPLFDFVPLPPVILKGKQEQQTVYELRGPRAQPGRLRGLEPLGLSAPLVGREAEVERLQAALARLSGGQGGVVSILGEAGLGKSRLVAELHQGSALAWYEGRCLSYGEMLPYHPFQGLLRNLMGTPLDADVPALEAGLHGLLERLLPGHEQEIYPYLADILGLPLSPAVHEQMNMLAGESRQWQTFQAFEQLLFASAHDSPLVVVIEDLHWADPTSLALLEKLLPLTMSCPLLLLLVMRPFAGPHFEQLFERVRASQSIAYEEVALTPLSSDESRELVGYLLAIEALPGPVRDLILSRAEGNPFFLEEILRSLIGQGLLQRETERWRMSPSASIDQISIPPTLQGVILARLDRLDAESKAVLQIAAVVGRIFWYRVLDYVASVERHLEQVLDQHLSSLEQVELIRQVRQHPEVEYIFKHVLIQEAAYESLLKERRRVFHKRVAEALERIFGGSLEEQSGLLAHHYEAAGEVEKAIDYLQMAGGRAQHTYALEEAEGYYQRALELLPEEDGERAAHLRLQLGLVSLAQGKFDRAGEHYAAAFRRPQGLPARRQSFAPNPLRLSWWYPPRTFEPAMATDIYSNQVSQQLFAGLVEFDEEMHIVPQMAERWEVDQGGKRYRFYLRPDARWSDGTPLTAHDFIFAWRRWLNPETEAEMGPLLQIIEGAWHYSQGEVGVEEVGVRALDDRTLEVDLFQPTPYFLPLLVTGPFCPLPSHCWPPVRPAEEDPGGLVCNGPFRIAEWNSSGQRLILERNPSYSLPTGNVGRIEISFGATDEEKARLFAEGQLDVCPIGDGEIFAQLIPAERRINGPQLLTLYCGLMSHWAPLDNLQVRQALVQAVDRRRLSGLLSPQTHLPARGGFIPAGMPGHSPELTAPYNPEHARALIREASFGAGLPPLRFFWVSAQGSPVIEELMEQWRRELGVELQVETHSIGEFMQSLRGEGPHLFTMTWVADYPDPHSVIGDGLPQGGHLDEQEHWDRVTQAATMMDVRQRMGLYHEIDRRILVDQALIIPLGYGRQSVGVQRHVKHYPLLPVSYFPLKNVVVE